MFFQEFQEEAEAVRNYVGALEELATRNMWAPPKYDEAQFQGKPNKDFQGNLHAKWGDSHRLRSQKEGGEAPRGGTTFGTTPRRGTGTEKEEG